jgi:hypothetical protein
MWNFASVFLALFLTLALLTSPMTNGQTTSSYISPTGKMGTHYSLTVYSPNNETVYTDSMPLSFSIFWSYDLLPINHIVGLYAYSIDNNSFVNIASNETANDRYAQAPDNPKFFKYNPSFAYSIDITNLTDGYHKIAVFGLFYFGSELLLNQSSPPIEFSVHNSIPVQTPNPTIPSIPSHTTSAGEIPLQIIAVVLIVSAIVIGALIAYFKKDKPETTVTARHAPYPGPNCTICYVPSLI